MEHRNLTGDSLHEPKGVESATAGQVYVANGTGSGTWQDRLNGIINLNTYGLGGRIDSISDVSSAFFVIPQKANLTKIYGVLSAAITGANSVITIYKNSIAQTPTLTVPFTGSGPGVSQTFSISPNIAVLEGDIIELRSDGGSTGNAVYSVGLKLTATV